MFSKIEATALREHANERREAVRNRQSKSEAKLSVHKLSLSEHRTEGARINGHEEDPNVYRQRSVCSGVCFTGKADGGDTYAEKGKQQKAGRLTRRAHCLLPCNGVTR